MAIIPFPNARRPGLTAGPPAAGGCVQVDPRAEEARQILARATCELAVVADGLRASADTLGVVIDAMRRVSAEGKLVLEVIEAGDIAAMERLRDHLSEQRKTKW